MPSAHSSTDTPRMRRFVAIAAIRSVSLTRNSRASLTVVRPSAQAAATHMAGNSSMARGTVSPLDLLASIDAFRRRPPRADVSERQLAQVGGARSNSGAFALA